MNFCLRRTFPENYSAKFFVLNTSVTKEKLVMDSVYNTSSK